MNACNSSLVRGRFQVANPNASVRTAELSSVDVIFASFLFLLLYVFI
jgi:hypothetical protein